MTVINTHKEKQPSLAMALAPICFLVAFLTLNMIFFGNDNLSGPNQVALIFSAAFAALIARFYKIKWELILKSMVDRVSSAMPSVLILLLIGSLAGTWLISGVIPVIVYYGLDIIHPRIFLVATVVVCSLVSLAIGSSWTTVATVGLALNGIGQAMGIHPGIVAGAIISGAYFGDKLSPLSDTTNLAPAMTGTDIFTHIRCMLTTTVPSYILTLVIFSIIGFTYTFGDITSNTLALKTTINEVFHVTPVLLFVPLFLIAIIVVKTPALPALLAAIILGGVFAIIFQPDMVKQVSGYRENYLAASFVAFLKAVSGEVVIDTGNPALSGLLKSDGMAGMLNTVWIILSAMVFGGAMEAASLLKRIALSIIRFARSTGSLVLSTVVTCIFFNLTASDQYFAIVIPGRMFAPIYSEKGLKPEMLSRTLEDAGTLTSVLVPWNTCGAFQSQVLGVSVLTYLPYCFFNLINPIMAVLMAYMGYKIKKVTVVNKNNVQ